MADDFKSMRDNLFKVLTGIRITSPDFSPAEEDDEEDASDRNRIDAGAARALISALFARAGKGKDEVVQIIAREIGVAVAAMLREPLSQLAKHQKLQISFEFVPKHGHPPLDDEQDSQAGRSSPSRLSRARKTAGKAQAHRTSRSSSVRKSGKSS